MLLLVYPVVYSFNPTAYSGQYKAWISIRPDNSTIGIDAFCQSTEDGYVRYRLEARKAGRAGEAKTSQSGLVYLRSKGEIQLSRLTMGISAMDRYEIRLEVYKEGKVVAEDSISYPNP